MACKSATWLATIDVGSIDRWESTDLVLGKLCSGQRDTWGSKGTFTAHENLAISSVI